MRGIPEKIVLYAILVLNMACVNRPGSSSTKHTNVIFFLVDDLGWMDTGCYGGTFYETPAIDKLAAGGVRFTNAYSAHPVCGPSRAALLSGKAPLRMGNTGVSGKLSTSDISLAEAFKEYGYSTFFAGKWHVGMTNGRSPLDQGFDHAIGVNTEGQPGSYFYPYKDTGCDLPGTERRVLPERDVPGLEDGKEGEYLTDRLTEETVSFIEEHKDRPFFVYLSHYAVHTPLEAKEEYVKVFEKKNMVNGVDGLAILKEIEGRAHCRQNRSNPIYGAMVKSLDESLGTLMNKLVELNLEKNTIIVFTSDNGGLSCLKGASPHIPTSNIPLKYGKGWAYEGGIRVPAIIKAPQIKQKGSISDQVICGYDFYPTILKLAGIPLLPEQHMDGKAWVPGAKILERTICWYYPHEHGSGHMPSAAVRSGNYKLIWYLTEDRVELYNLEDDISEHEELSRQFPDKTKELKDYLENWINDTKPD